jgi:hypothetical protein
MAYNPDPLQGKWIDLRQLGRLKPGSGSIAHHEWGLGIYVIRMSGAGQRCGYDYKPSPQANSLTPSPHPKTQILITMASLHCKYAQVNGQAAARTCTSNCAMFGSIGIIIQQSS